MSSNPDRGSVWLCRHGGKVRPVVVMSRPAVHRRLAKLTVVPISSTIRGWPDEVTFARGEAGLRVASVAQCREIAHIPKNLLVAEVGNAGHRLDEMCRAITSIVGC